MVLWNREPSAEKKAEPRTQGIAGDTLKFHLLDERLREHSSAVEWLRLLAATIVVLFHCFALNRMWGSDPLRVLLPGLELGSLGVQIFFFLSGLLVAQSYVRHRSLVKFAAARMLRLYPALIAATLFTIALSAWSSTLDLRGFLASPDTLTFAVRRALGLVAVDALPGAFQHNPYPVAVNGSLWTLPIEIQMYLVVAVAGVLGLLTRKWLVTVATIVLIALFIVRPSTFPISPDFIATRTLALMFALGSLSFVWRAHIPVSLPLGIACGALLILSQYLRTQPAVSAVLIGYSVLIAAYHPLTQNLLPRLAADLSYGIYVYSFPIQQTLIERAGDLFIGKPWALFPAALLVIAPIAALSWFLLEKPALTLKVR